MTTEYLGPCSVDGCEKPATRDTEDHGLLCESHRRRTHPSREGGIELSVPVRERPADTGEWLRKAALDYAEAESDVEYAEAARELDEVASTKAALKRAKRNLDRAAEAHGYTVARRAMNQSISEGLKRARAAGVQVGRPRKLTYEGALEAVAQAGSIAKAARNLGVHHETIRRTLRRKSEPFAHADMHSAVPTRPPSTPDSEE